MSTVTNSKWLAKVSGVLVGLVVAAQAQAAPFSVNRVDYVHGSADCDHCHE